MRSLHVTGTALLVLVGSALLGCAPSPGAHELDAQKVSDLVAAEESAEGDEVASTEPAPATEEAEGPDGPPSLFGEWTEEGGDGASRQSAGISETSIVVRWTLDDNLSGLYWAGTFVPPTEPGGFAWTSEVYEALTDGAILASGLDQKVFSYEDGLLIYEVSYMGVTEEIRLEKISAAVPEFVFEVDAELESQIG